MAFVMRIVQTFAPEAVPKIWRFDFVSEAQSLRLLPDQNGKLDFVPSPWANEPLSDGAPAQFCKHDKVLPCAQLTQSAFIGGVVVMQAFVKDVWVRPDSQFLPDAVTQHFPRLRIHRTIAGKEKTVLVRHGDVIMFERLDMEITFVYDDGHKTSAKPHSALKPLKNAMLSRVKHKPRGVRDLQYDIAANTDDLLQFISVSMASQDATDNAADATSAESLVSSASHESLISHEVAQPTVADITPESLSSDRPDSLAVTNDIPVAKVIDRDWTVMETSTDNVSSSPPKTEMPCQDVVKPVPSTTMGGSIANGAGWLKRRASMGGDREGRTRTSKKQKPSTTPDLSLPPAGARYSGPPPCMLFSHTQIEKQEGIMRFFKRHNGRKSDHIVKFSNFLCVGAEGTLKTTAKLLYSLIHNKTIVTDKWLEDSSRIDYLLDPTPYLPTELVPTVHWNRKRLFHGRSVYYTRAIKKEYGAGYIDMDFIVGHAGARIVDGVVAIGVPDLVAIGSEKSDEQVEQFKARGIKCYKKTLVTDSIMQGRLLLDDEQYLL